MNIALFTDCFHPQINGVVIAVDNLAKGLAEKGEKVLIVTTRHRGEPPKPAHPNIEILTVRGGPAYFYREMKIAPPFSKKIYRKLKEFQPDIFHLHTPLTIGFQAILFSRLFHRPLVGTFHTFFSESDYLKHAKLDYKIMQQIAWKLIRFYYNKCDVISTPSPRTTAILRENRCKEPLVTISNGIDPALFQNGGTGELIRQKSHPGDFKALYVGRLAHEKNLPALMDIFRSIMEKNPSVKLFLIGDGPQKKTMEKFLQKHALKENILFLGKIPHQELIQSGIYQACDLFVTASKTETQGITILEALASGLPVIAMASKGIPDLVENGVNGFLVPEDDTAGFTQKVEQMIKNKEQHRLCKTRTAQSIEKHHISHVIEEWEKVYQQAIQSASLQKTGTEA